MTKRRWQGLDIALIVGAYVTSLPLPAMRNDAFPGVWSGWMLFAFGLQSILSGAVGMLVFWFPNLCLAVGFVLLLFRRNRLAFILGWVALLGACMWLPDIRNLSPGYYCWLASMVLLCVVAQRRHTMSTEQAVRDPTVPTLPDPSLLTLFNQPRTQRTPEMDIHPGAPPGDRCSTLQPPCSPSS